MRTGLISVLLLSTAPAVAVAQPVTSAGPEKVAVTVYRDPNRGAETKMSLMWLNGFALVSETRTVSIPAGKGTIRFEGVAGGIVPESAVVTGLPAGVREKNLDADLLTPGSLYARSYGRSVTLRRTVNGKTTEERAVIRSGEAGPAILQTKDGFMAVNCGPDREDIIYDQVPPGLSSKPTLSVETESDRAVTATVQLTYLATGFDWQASYVATMRPDGRSADLFAWVTLASTDRTSFEDAETMVVAGKLERDPNSSWHRNSYRPDFELECFGEMMAYGGAYPPPPPPPAPPPPPVAMAAPMMESVVVTGARMVRQEELGDLKLYRVPDRTTVAARAQKQVALLDRGGVPVQVVHRMRIWSNQPGEVEILLRMQNRERDKLGLPLPAGGVTVFQPRGDSHVLVGEGSIEDKAIDEEVEIRAAGSSQVSVETQLAGMGGRWEDQLLKVSNANPFPVRFEAEFYPDTRYARGRVSARLKRKNGRDLWDVTVPANGTATLRYRLTKTGG